MEQSVRKLFAGDFDSEENHTAVSIFASLWLSIANLDAPLDLRDLTYDLMNWGKDDNFAVQFILDLIGILPIIGAFKYLKHCDDVSDAGKTIKHAADGADVLHDIDKTVEDSLEVVKYFDSAEITADLVKDVERVGDYADDFSDIEKSTEFFDAMEDSIKNSDEVEEIAKDQVVINKAEGIRREEEVLEKLTSNYGEENVMREVYIRDCNSKIISDPETGVARRIDFMVLDGDNVIQSIEVTSNTAKKDEQIAKELRIINKANENGGAYIKNRNTGELIRLPEDFKTEIVRLK